MKIVKNYKKFGELIKTIARGEKTNKIKSKISYFLKDLIWIDMIRRLNLKSIIILFII